MGLTCHESLAEMMDDGRGVEPSITLDLGCWTAALRWVEKTYGLRCGVRSFGMICAFHSLALITSHICFN